MSVRERPSGWPVVCRGCGDWGYEEPDDPCPGLCPRCFNDLLHAQLAHYLDDLDDRSLTDVEVADRLSGRLRGAGLSDAARLQIEGRVRRSRPKGGNAMRDEVRTLVEARLLLDAQYLRVTGHPQGESREEVARRHYWIAAMTQREGLPVDWEYTALRMAQALLGLPEGDQD